MNNIIMKHTKIKKMVKYRIVEENGMFYPQEKECWLFSWMYIDCYSVEFTWYLRINSVCESLFEAEEIIQKRIKYLNKKKQIIHEYNPLNNDN